MFKRLAPSELQLTAVSTDGHHGLGDSGVHTHCLQKRNFKGQSVETSQTAPIQELWTA